MISLRYHVVSLAAVFLALAVGLVLGAGGVSDRLLGAMATKADGLTGQVQQLTAQRDALAAAQRADDEFSRRVAPAAVRGVLQGQSVALVTSGADGPTRDALVELIKQSGATVTGTVALTPAVTDPARADQLRQLTGTLLPAGAQLPAAADTGSLLGGLLGGVLTGPSGQAPVTGPQAEGVLNGLSAAGFTTAGPAPGPAGLVLVLGGGALTVTAALSTVDNVETGAGQISTVLALREQVDGHAGRYGTAGSAADGAAPRT